jgi:hypothetical protein
MVLAAASPASPRDRSTPWRANLTFQSNPSGLQLTAGPTTAKAPFTITTIMNGTIP